MVKPPTHLTFKLDDIAIVVCASKAYLVLDDSSSIPLSRSSQDSGGESLVYRGMVIPCLDIRDCLNLPAAAEPEECRSLILEDSGQLVCLNVAGLNVCTGAVTTSTSEVRPSFTGLARLLLAEERQTTEGVMYLLDVEMAVQVANQARERAARACSLV